MRPEVEARLERFAEMVYRLGKQSHNTPQEFPKAVSLFISIYREHGFVHSDDVKHWFRHRGWSDDNARDIGYLADVVWHTMHDLGEVS